MNQQLSISSVSVTSFKVKGLGQGASFPAYTTSWREKTKPIIDKIQAKLLETNVKLDIEVLT